MLTGVRAGQCGVIERVLTGFYRVVIVVSVVVLLNVDVLSIINVARV